MHITNAKKEQAHDLAVMTKLAGDGLPFYLWQILGNGKVPPMEVGRKRAEREDGAFSYKKARVCIESNEITGIALSYILSNKPSLENLHENPDPVIPILMLETKALGSWYINAIAVSEQHRNKGVGTLLLKDCEKLARKHACNEMSLITNSHNKVAIKLYGRLGFLSRDQIPVVHYPGCPAESHWVLMIKQLQ